MVAIRPGIPTVGLIEVILIEFAEVLQTFVCKYDKTFQK